MRHRVAFAVVIALSLVPVAPATSQESARHRRALVAGYKASFLCSGLFTAGQTEAEVARADLARIYPEYRELIATLPAQVDRQAKTVAVSFADDMPPRIAAWRPHLGCAQLPIGAGNAQIASLPRLAASPPAATLDARPWPLGDEGANVKPPSATGVEFSRTIDAAFDRKTYGEGTETTAVIVVAGGKIVGERYRDGYDKHRPQRTWSVAKSLAVTAIGAAVHQGLVDVGKAATIPEWRQPGDPRSAVTLENLLHMASGLYSEAAGNRTDMVYFGGTSVTEKATGMPLEAPSGKRWLYANNDTLLAARALRASLGDGERALAFPFTELLWKIGMTRTTLETDWQGNYILSSQVWTTARDLARLGLLYLNDGIWQGERLLPQGWSTYVARPAPAQPDNATTGNGPGYGAQFWLFGPKQGLPAGTYAAQGNRGQYVMIVPSRDIVVVRRGFDAVGDGSRFDIARFTADILAAIPQSPK